MSLSRERLEEIRRLAEEADQEAWARGAPSTGCTEPTCCVQPAYLSALDPQTVGDLVRLAEVGMEVEEGDHPPLCDVCGEPTAKHDWKVPWPGGPWIHNHPGCEAEARSFY